MGELAATEVLMQDISDNIVIINMMILFACIVLAVIGITLASRAYALLSEVKQVRHDTEVLLQKCSPTYANLTSPTVQPPSNLFSNSIHVHQAYKKPAGISRKII